MLMKDTDDLLRKLMWRSMPSIINKIIFYQLNQLIIMKRYDLPQKYMYWIWMAWLMVWYFFGIICCLIIFTGLEYGISKIPDLPIICTPSYEHQELMATLSGLSMQVSEENSQCMFLLDKYIK